MASFIPPNLFQPKRLTYGSMVNNEMGRLGTRAGGLEGTADTERAGAQAAYQNFNPDDFLSSGALSSIFDQAGVGFRGDLASLRSTNARRGIRGPLAGATEGDLTSAFQRNLMSTTANFSGQRANLALQRAQGLSQRADSDSELANATRGQGLELLLGERDNEVDERRYQQDRAAARRRGLGAGIGGVLGAGAGFLIGGPAGMGAGFAAGSSLGAGVGG